MRAVVAREGSLAVESWPEPEPRAGEALVAVRACGICGSDIHTLAHAHDVGEVGEILGTGDLFDPAQPYVLGHEYSAEVLDLGPGTEGSPVEPGDLVVSMPFLFRDTGIVPLGFANEPPGAYGERMLLTAGLCHKVPNGLDHRRAALTEPMAVALHAVEKSGIREGEAAVVVGLGPIGLALLPWLRRRGIAPIVAADYSPRRRELALEMGAHEVVDPRDERVVDAWRRVDGVRPLVIFEAVGVPGMLEDVIEQAPGNARVLVAGVCMPPDTFRPLVAVVKELSLQFVYCYQPHEFVESLQAIAEGEVDVTPLMTGVVGLDGVADAFGALRNPEEHVKVLVEPGAGPTITAI